MSAVAPHRTRRTIRTLTGALVASTLLGTVACAGGDSSTGPRTPSKNIAGLYALYTVNKKPIPSQIYRGRYYYPDLDYTFDDLSITVTGGELILQDNGQFHLAVDLRFAANGGEQTGSRSIDGQYEVSGDQVTLIDRSGSVTAPLQQGYIWVNIDPGATGTKQTYYFKYTP